MTRLHTTTIPSSKYTRTVSAVVEDDEALLTEEGELLLEVEDESLLEGEETGADVEGTLS